MAEDNLMRELQEEERQRRMHALMMSILPWVIAAALALLLAVGGREFWQHWQQQKREQSATLFYHVQEALAKNESSKAVALLDTMEDKALPVYRVLAYLTFAGQQQRLGNDEAAAQALAAAKRHAEGQDDLRGLMEVAMLVHAEEKETVEAYNVLTASARLQQAMDLSAEGKKAEAATLLQSLQEDAAAPVSLQQRAAMLAAQLPPVPAAAEETSEAEETPAASEGN